jgi:hypothetical protein
MTKGVRENSKPRNPKNFMRKESKDKGNKEWRGGKKKEILPPSQTRWRLGLVSKRRERVERLGLIKGWNGLIGHPKDWGKNHPNSRTNSLQHGKDDVDRKAKYTIKKSDDIGGTRTWWVLLKWLYLEFQTSDWSRLGGIAKLIQMYT